MRKQKDTSKVRLPLRQAQSYGSPQASLSGVILQKLSTLENLLKKKDDKPLTFKEACAYLGYAPSYLYKLTYRKIIPHYKPTGKIIFFSKAELDEWIYKSGCQNSEISKQNDSSTSLEVTKENERGSTVRQDSLQAQLTTKDPNQMEIGFDEQKGRRNEEKNKRFDEEKSKENASLNSTQGHKIVIEFPRKKKR
ncbi:MAG: helix-turn-helix domain-containing protein [Ignavibacteriales bacterium]|nr:helix-turn-helix domain-containing protein [Ignavibacteriales bacterium]